MRSAPCVCLSFMYVQNLSTARVCCGWLAQSAVRFLLFSDSPFLYGLPYLGIGPCLRVGFAFSSVHHFANYHFLPYYSIVPTVKLFALILLGLFKPAIYSSPNGPVRPLVLLLHHWWAPVSHSFSLGRLGPVCFP